MFFQLLIAAQIFAATIGASQQDVTCWENVGQDVAGAQFVCEIEQEKDGIHAYLSSDGNGGIVFTVDARPWFEYGAEESVKTAEPFGLYVEALMEDGDTQNDWLTHLPQDRQSEAKAIGDLLNATFGADNENTDTVAAYIFETIDTGDAQNPWLQHLPLGGQAAAQVAGEFAASLDWMG